MSYTKDNGIDERTAEQVMRVGPVDPGSYEEGLAHLTEISEDFGAPDVATFMAHVGAGAFFQISGALGIVTGLCLGNKELITQLFDETTKVTDEHTTDPTLKQHGLGRLLAGMAIGLLDAETVMRQAVIDGVVICFSFLHPATSVGGT